MRTFVALGVLIAVAVLAAVAWAYAGGGQLVEAAPARRGPVAEFIDEQARTRLPRTHLVTMPYPGRLEEIELEIGDEVRAGQVVARVSPQDLQLERDVVQARVAQLEASIAENEDLTIERTALEQTLSYVQSMNLAVEAAEKRVEAGEARLNFAREQLDRAESLLRADRAITREEYDAARLRHVEADVNFQQDRLVHRALQALQAATVLAPTLVRQYIDRKTLQTAVLNQQRAAAVAERAQVDRRVERGQMASPVDGVVLERRIRDERFLSAGETLLEIGRLEDMEIEVEVLSQDVVRVREGQTVEIYGPAIGPTPAAGRVARIYPAGFTKISSLGVEQQRVLVIVRLTDEAMESLRRQRRLGVNYRVRVRIFTAQQDDALTIPRSGLFRGAAGQWQVFAIRDGRAQLQDVEVGLMNDERVAIVRGLEAGEHVVLAPESGLVSGTRVQQAATPMPAPRPQAAGPP